MNYLNLLKSVITKVVIKSSINYLCVCELWPFSFFFVTDNSDYALLKKKKRIAKEKTAR